MQMKLNSYNTYFDTLIPELKRLELDIDKAKAWFKDNPLQLDLHLRGYSEKIRLTWLNEIFSHDITIQEMSLRTKVANTKDKELGAQLNHINSFFFRKTIFGLIKYCTESSGNWVDPVKQDNVYRFAWFHHVIANELDAAFHSWIKGEVGKYLLCSIPPQHAKAQPLTSNVYTKEGKKQIGELSLGEEIDNGTGGYSKIIKLHDISTRPIYRFTFEDGRTVEAADNHNWEVLNREWNKSKVLTTLDIIEYMEKSSVKDRLYIPNYIPIDSNVEVALPIDPYLLGVLLGDGSFRTGSITLTTADSEIVDRVSTLVKGMDCELVKNTTNEDKHKYGYRVRGAMEKRVDSRGRIARKQSNALKEKIIELGLLGKTSHTKFIPECYMSASYSQKLDFIQGLMDTDGTVGLSNTKTFTTSSETLASQFAELIRSIGGFAKISKKTSKLNGKITGHHYSIGIKVNSPSELFSLSRKKDRCTSSRQYSKLRIKSIEYVRDDLARCISVDSPRNLYATDGYVVTHNSTLFAGGLIPMIMGNVPTAKGVLGTYNADFAASVLQKDTMNIIDSDGYVKLFGRIFNKNLSATEKKTFTLNGITPPTDSAQKKGTTKGGRIFAGSMKQLTGNPAQFILIDDPIPNAAVARSEDEVNKITQEYDASAMSRVRNNTLVAVIHCITGDANILLSDNTTKRMDELKVGDVLKTYDKTTGKPSNNEVLHFIPQGRDKVYRIKTKSTNVKANERHPFLVDRIKV
jgi:hypothetical protein